MATTTTHCVHRWAHNEDKLGSGKTGNMSYRGMSFYSYETVIAVKYPGRGPGRGTVVFAGGGIYNSTTTAGHKSKALQALHPGWAVLYVDIPGSIRYPYVTMGDPITTLKGIRMCHDAYKKNARKMVRELNKDNAIRSRVKRWREYCEYLKAANDIAEFLNRKELTHADLGIMHDTVIEFEKLSKEAYERQKEINEKSRATREENRAREWEADKARWRAHEIAEEARRAESLRTEPERSARWRNHDYTGDTWMWNKIYLRVSNDGKNVQTTRGVVVPIRDAHNLFKLCRYVKDTGWQNISENVKKRVRATRIDGYEVNTIDNHGHVRLGCHFLEYGEMENCFNVALERGLVTREQL